jgi:hypothetical protein
MGELGVLLGDLAVIVGAKSRLQEWNSGNHSRSPFNEKPEPTAFPSRLDHRSRIRRKSPGSMLKAGRLATPLPAWLCAGWYDATSIVSITTASKAVAIKQRHRRRLIWVGLSVSVKI